MTKEEIRKKVVPIVAKYLCEDESGIDTNADMRDTSGADSLDIVGMTMDVERAFGISISNDAVESFNTAQDIIDEVKRNILD